MSEQNKIQLFENQPIRTAWNEEQEEWYFSVVDVIHVLTGSENPRRYWSDLKRKLKSEGATQLYENIVQLKMKSSDGKNYKTDAATTEQLLRIIQSIPSPRAEPVKRWLAEVGRERIEETIDPEQAIDRALETYLKKGYDPDWVHQRLLSSAGHISNKTLYIALNYEEQAERMNAESAHEIAKELFALECEQRRLTYFIGLLDKRQAEVIRLVFVDGIPTKEVAASFGLTYRTIDRIKRTAIENLAEMYAYSDQFRV